MFQYAEGEEPETEYETIDWRDHPGDKMPETFLQDWKTTPLYKGRYAFGGFTWMPL
ncbi:MAG: hypothetical protein Ct9H300mP4_15210 [Gammaproteobacteria bacterium]|nr:MAG: hypothetical protein Ct9H300mP4_15210 [Gammaproteobacteria bacterium]